MNCRYFTIEVVEIVYDVAGFEDEYELTVDVDSLPQYCMINSTRVNLDTRVDDIHSQLEELSDLTVTHFTCTFW